MAQPLMPSIEPDSIAREQSAHELWEPRWATEQKQMDVIVHEGPGKDSRPGSFPYLADSRNKTLTVFVVAKYIGSLYTANHHMMKRSGSI